MCKLQIEINLHPYVKHGLQFTGLHETQQLHDGTTWKVSQKSDVTREK
jgi:hypothetical protein